MTNPSKGHRLIAALCLLFLVNLCLAQTDLKHDSLKEVVVIADQVRLQSHFSQLEKISSEALQRTPPTFLSDVLQWNSHWFVLSYGPGLVSTAAHRGNNAEQVRIFWNGVPLNHPALGMLDLSLVPALLFDDVSLLHTGASVQVGNGSLGGNVFLGSNQNQHDLHLRHNTTAGSFGYFQQLYSAQFNSGRWYSSSKFLWQRSDNDYLFQPLHGERRPLQNAAYNQRHFMQELGFRINNKHRVEANLWLMDKFTEIPPTISGNQRQIASLEDRNAVASLSYSHKRNAQSGQLFQYSYFFTDQWYKQNLPDIESYNPARSHFAEYHWYEKRGKLRYKAGSNFTYAFSPGENLSDDNFQAWFGLFGEVAYEVSNRYDAELSLRQEWVNGFDPPISGAFTNRYHLNDAWKLEGRYSRNYRIPTLNHLYWEPVGNPDLLPEDNDVLEFSVIHTTTKHRLSITAYGSHTRNYIQWRPSIGPFWSATNLREVRAYGLELSHDYKHSIHKKAQIGSQLRAAGGRAYGVGEGDPYANLQLIYQPIYRISHSLFFLYDKWDVSVRYRYLSEMFGLPDHFRHANIPQSLIFAASIQRSLPTKNGDWRLSINAENLLNTQFQLQLGRPMPGFHYFVGINYDFFK